MAFTLDGLVFTADETTTIVWDGQPIPLDVALDSQHIYGQEVTGEALEDGSQADDHVVEDPDGLTIEGIVTDHPVGLVAGIVHGPIGDLLNLTDGALEPSITAYELWVKAKEAAAELVITTRFRVFERMVITRLTIRETAEFGHALRLSVAFRQVTKVQAQTVSASLLDTLGDGTDDLAAGTSDLGRQPTLAPTSAQADSLDGLSLEMDWPQAA